MPMNCGDRQQPCAIIIGLDSLQGLATARILARRQVPTIGIAKDPKHHSCRTKACQDIVYTNTDGEDLVRLLGAMGPQLNQRAVLFPCQDRNVLVISRHRQELEEWFHIVLPPRDVVEMLVNKVSFYTFAQEQGLPIPPTFFLRSRRDAQRAAKALRFPCVVKPPFRAQSWTQHTKVKAIKARTPEELLAVYDHYHEWTDTLIAQEWIEGKDANNYKCNCYFGADSEPLVAFTSRKLRQWPPQTGQGCSSVEARNDVVLRETIRLYRSVNHHGLGYLEMKRDDRSGKYLIIEPNVGRPTGGAALAEAVGVELIYTMYCDTIGWPLPADREQRYEGTKWFHLLRDLQASVHYWRKGELTLGEWYGSMRGKKTFAILSWRDPMPFLSAVMRAVPELFSPRERGIEDYSFSR